MKFLISSFLLLLAIILNGCGSKQEEFILGNLTDDVLKAKESRGHAFSSISGHQLDQQCITFIRYVEKEGEEFIVFHIVQKPSEVNLKVTLIDKSGGILTELKREKGDLIMSQESYYFPYEKEMLPCKLVLAASTTGV